MTALRIDHPNPALGLPTKTLANQTRMAIGFDRTPVGCKDNVAFTTCESVLSYAVENAANRMGTFFVVSWGWVNGEPISPLGFLCFDGRRFLFTPLNYGNEDFRAREMRMTVLDICYGINREHREDPDALQARRQWTTVSRGKDEDPGSGMIRRVSLLLSAILFRTPLSQEALYELAQ